MLVNNHDKEVVSDACWALSYLTDGSVERIQAVLDSGVAPRLVQLLGSGEITCMVSISYVHVTRMVMGCNLLKLIVSVAERRGWGS